MVDLRTGLLLVAITAVGASAGCRALLGIEGTDLTSNIVRVTAVGIIEPVSLRLDVGMASEDITIDREGVFAFESAVEEGESFTVTLIDATDCVLSGESGMVTDVAPEVTVACVGLVQLTALDVSGVSPDALDFSPGRTELAAEVSAEQQTVTITATAFSPIAVIQIDGVEVPTGQASEPIELDVGANEIDIEVTHALGVARTYRVTLSRPAPLSPVGLR